MTWHIVKPDVVSGQVHGGIAQGIGQALMENLRLYDSDGPAAERIPT